jgi:1-acyl-sn-glycerol-3-phosphate acyltransferase
MLVDPIMAGAELYRLGRPPHVWAKAPLFKHPVAGALLRAVGAIPVARPTAKTGSLVEAETITPEELASQLAVLFEASWDILKGGGCLLLFPEGTSYTESHLIEV